MSWGKLSKCLRHSPTGLSGITHREKSMQNYLLWSDFTRYSWKHWICSPSSSVYPSARWVNVFLMHSEILEYRSTFYNSCFQRGVGKTTLSNPKKITTWASAMMFSAGFKRQTPYCSGSGPAHLVPRDKTKREEGFAILPAAGSDHLTLLIPQHLFNLVVSSIRTRR